MIRFPGGTRQRVRLERSPSARLTGVPVANGADIGGSGPITTGRSVWPSILTLTAAATAVNRFPFANETTQDAADLVEYPNAPVRANPNDGIVGQRGGRPTVTRRRTE